VEAIQAEKAGTILRDSFAGRLGRAIEPIITPLGFDWRIGIGLVSSFAAREVFVSSMATVYNVANSNEDKGLAATLQAQKRPDGRPMYTTLTGLTLMVFYVFALQCISTVAIVRRETNSWRWPVFQWLYMGSLAWVFAFATWRIGLWLGFQ
jgi:ferrous iron transport protein B